jgi:hypothetical protein
MTSNSDNNKEPILSPQILFSLQFPLCFNSAVCRPSLVTEPTRLTRSVLFCFKLHADLPFFEPLRNQFFEQIIWNTQDL